MTRFALGARSKAFNTPPAAGSNCPAVSPGLAGVGSESAAPAICGLPNKEASAALPRPRLLREKKCRRLKRKPGSSKKRDLSFIIQPLARIEFVLPGLY